MLFSFISRYPLISSSDSAIILYLYWLLSFSTVILLNGLPTSTDNILLPRSDRYKLTLASISLVDDITWFNSSVISSLDSDEILAILVINLSSFINLSRILLINLSSIFKVAFVTYLELYLVIVFSYVASFNESFTAFRIDV